jgi:transcriptional regulator with XRE-family HTH domain
MSKSLHNKHYRSIIARLVAEREAKGISQTELAEKLESTQSAISKIERSERRLDVHEFVQWCAALGLSASDVIRDFEPQRRQKSK